jgi:hypothetical protein
MSRTFDPWHLGPASAVPVHLGSHADSKESKYPPT